MRSGYHPDPLTFNHLEARGGLPILAPHTVPGPIPFLWFVRCWISRATKKEKEITNGLQMLANVGVCTCVICHIHPK